MLSFLALRILPDTIFLSLFTKRVGSYCGRRHLSSFIESFFVIAAWLRSRLLYFRARKVSRRVALCIITFLY